MDIYDPVLDDPAIKKFQKIFPRKTKKELQKLYRILLVEGKRDINLDEFVHGIKKLRIFDGSLTDEDLMKVFNLLERNERITSEHFIPTVRGTLPSYRQKVVEFIFKKLNKSNGKYIKDVDLISYLKDSKLPDIILNVTTPRARATEVCQGVNRSLKGEFAEKEKCSRFSYEEFTEYYLDKSFDVRDDSQFLHEAVVNEWNFKKDEALKYITEATIQSSHQNGTQAPPSTSKPSAESPRTSGRFTSSEKMDRSLLQNPDNSEDMSAPHLMPLERQMSATTQQEKRRMRQQMQQQQQEASNAISAGRDSSPSNSTDHDHDSGQSDEPGGDHTYLPITTFQQQELGSSGQRISQSKPTVQELSGGIFGGAEDQSGSSSDVSALQVTVRELQGTIREQMQTMMEQQRTIAQLYERALKVSH